MAHDKEQFMRGFSEKDKMGSFVGNRLVDINENECICEYIVKPEHHNPNGILHGGALFTAMDSSQGAFVHFNLDQKFKWAATGTAVVKYLAPVRSGRIRIRTWLRATEGRKLFVDSSATDESGKEVCTVEEIWIASLR